MSNSMKIVTVVPLKKGLWREDLTYFSGKDIPNGSIVTVPLRSKKVLGLVIDSTDASASKSDIKKMSFNLKKIIEVKENSIFLKEYLIATIEISKYFASSKNNGVTTLIPAILRENYDKVSKTINGEKIIQIEENSRKNKIKSEKVIFQAPALDRMSYYKTLIRGAFAEKKSVFIILPTESDIKIFEEALSKGIEQFAFAFHAGINPKKILKKFKDVVNLAHPVLILGTAPFLCIPRNDIGFVIAEHESSNAYKMIARPHFDLRTFAEIFAVKINAKFILSDTLLRFETLAREKSDELLPLRPLSYRISPASAIEIYGRGNVETQGGKKFNIITDESLREIQNTVVNKKNVFIFALRKGLASMTICKECGEMVSCNTCGAPLVLYLSNNGQKRIFACNRCEEKKDGDITCALCGSWNLVPLGIGIDTVYEYLKENLLEVKVFKLDKDSAKTAKGAEKIIKEFLENPGSILVGTEMAFFYMREKASLSVIASFDSLWSIPNYKMGEKIIHIALSIMEKTADKFIIQTKNEKDPAMQAIKSGNLLSFVRDEIEDRKKLGYPPFKRFIKITHFGNKEEAQKARRGLEEVFKDYNPEIFSGFISRLKGKYATNALIKLEPRKWSLSEISAGSSINETLYAKLTSLPPAFEVSVDPEDLL